MALTSKKFGAIEPEGADAEQDFAWVRRRHRALFDEQVFRPARRSQDDRSHGLGVTRRLRKCAIVPDSSQMPTPPR
jgi:hypothetical protein